MKRFTLLASLLVVLALVTSVAAQTGETYYVKARSARVRAEATTNASIVTNLRSNTAVVVLEVVEGVKVSGSTVWYRIDVSGIQGYIHSSLVTNVAPAAPVVSSGGNSGGNQTLQSTPAPLVEQPVAPPPSSGASCGGASTCGQMGSCEQAYACLAAGNRGLDRDKDGVPCESICPGG